VRAPACVGVQYPESRTGDEARGRALLKDHCNSCKVQASMKKRAKRNSTVERQDAYLYSPLQRKQYVVVFKKHDAKFK
jgi:hypothetical protein